MGYENKALKAAVYLVNLVGALVLVVTAYRGSASIAVVAFFPLLIVPSVAFALLPKQARNLPALLVVLAGSIAAAVIGSKALYDGLFANSATKTPMTMFMAPLWQALIYCITMLLLSALNKMIKPKESPED